MSGVDRRAVVRGFGRGREVGVERLLGFGDARGVSGRVAMIVLQPFSRGFEEGRGDARGSATHRAQPFVPIARRYSVTMTLLVGGRSTASAVVIAG